ncbi:MAG: MarR family transcriptional regulator [Solirubrobacteraceae bacterium]|nr:MarR family transcriptional regulator [Solirubrobacteraceae bacterium]
MTATAGARIAEQPCFAIHSTARAIARAYRPLLEPLGLTYPQYVVMMLLWERDGVDQRTLAAGAHLDPATLTPVLQRLERRGLLVRGRSTDDERRLVITLTAAGRALRRDAAHVPDAMLCQVGLRPDQEAALREICALIVTTLDGDPTERGG